ncbi:MAG TPA: hypothetical protein PLV92_23065, partial [Pirellulaceae bacterium]|nr:hypothetical protein [Pirellulaceae bacterium]
MPPVLLLHGLATNAERTWRDTGWIDLVRDSGSSVIAPDLLTAATRELPELPDAMRERFRRDYGLSDYDANLLTASRALAAYFEQVSTACGDAKLAAN